MSKKPLDRLAEAYGLQLSYLSNTGELRAPDDAAKRAVLRAMGVTAEDAKSLAQCLTAAPVPPAATIAAPEGARCFLPAWLARGRAWGVTCQLYGLRSRRNHGIGDFEDLACLAERLAAAGADFIGINPVHALFTAEPKRCSPFSPSNRRFLNPLYIALDNIPGIDIPPVVDETTRTRLAAAAQINYCAVATLKLGALRALWRRIADEPTAWAQEARTACEAYVDLGGAPLVAHARFEALSHYMVAEGKGAGWHAWPAALRDSSSEAVRRFSAEHDEEVRFHLWLQWIADVQLGAAAKRACAAGMRIGLYLDFAVGTAPDGSATWTDPTLAVPGASIGAPPDAFFAAGQDWGLAPLSPAALRARRLVPYCDELESVMRHAGAIRIDHAMSLYRLFWIPHGRSPAAGCYVLYPMADMLRALADVSTAQRSIVIGEDLGTVPKGFSKTLQGLGLLSYRVLYFERTRAGYRTAASFPPNAFLSASTHDLPPLAAWWAGADIALFGNLGLLDAAGIKRRRKERDVDRRALIARLQKEANRRSFAVPVPADDDARRDTLSKEVAVAVHAFLARARSRLVGVQFEDLCGAAAPVNVPGTSDQYPNWRLRADTSIECAADSGLWSSIVEAVARERPRRG